MGTGNMGGAHRVIKLNRAVLDLISRHKIVNIQLRHHSIIRSTEAVSNIIRKHATGVHRRVLPQVAVIMSAKLIEEYVVYEGRRGHLSLRRWPAP